MDRTERAAQLETARQRWADDGGFIPEHEPVPVKVRFPWAVAVAAAVGFVVGWMTARR